MVHRPRLVLLDEPTTGADVHTRGQILRFVRHIAEEGAAVVYSTHYLPEIEDLDASVAMIDHGRVIAQGGVSQLIRKHGSSAVELTFEGGEVPAAACVPEAIVHGTSVRIPTEDPADTAARLLQRLGTEITRLRGIEIVRPSLEAVFLSVTGRRYDPAPKSAA